MSTTNVTNEVVRMTFEGSDFEKQISKSLSTLQKLKEHLSFKKVASEAEDQMSSMARALDTMAHKAEAVWDRVTSKIKDSITDKIMGTLREVQDMTINQVAKGWDKYAEKTSAVATLVGQGYNMDEVNKQMEILNRFTDETSYNFNEMVNSIGKFTASGQSLEDANLAMQGIANWAALSGANATKASSAMYQLSQAMGKGALKYDDYKSIQNMGMDTQEFRKQALEAAVALGTLRKNADDTFTVINDDGKAIDDYTFTLTNFTEYLSKGEWLTSDVMMKTFSRYGSAIDHINEQIESGQADIATDAIKNLETENDRIRQVFKQTTNLLEMSDDEISDALNKWTKVQDVTEEAIDNYLQFNKEASREQAQAFLHQEYIDNLAAFAKEFNLETADAEKFLKESSTWTDTFGLKAYKAAQEAKTFRDAIDSVKDAASTQWMNVWEHLFGDYATAKNVWTKFANYLYDLLVDWLNGINEALDDWVDRGGREILLGAFSALGDVLMDIKGLIGDVTTILFGEFTGKGFLNATKSFKHFAERIRDFVKAVREAGIIQNVAYSLKAIADAFKSVINSLILAYRSAFPKMAAELNPIVLGFKGISEAIRAISEFISGVFLRNTANIRKMFSGILSIVQGIKSIISTVVGVFTKNLTPGLEEVGETANTVFDNIFDFFGKIGDKLKEFGEKMRSSEFLEKVAKAAEKLKEFYVTFIQPVLEGLINLAWNVARVVGAAFAWMGERVWNALKKIPWEKIKEFLIYVKEKLAPIGEGIKKLGTAFKEGIGSIVDSMSSFNESDERSFFQKIIDAIAEGFRVFKERLSDAWGAFKGVIHEITQSQAWKSFVDFIKKTFTKIKQVFNDYVKPVFVYIWEVVSGPVKKVLGMLREGKIGEILDLVKKAYQIGTLKRIMDFFKTFREFFKDAHIADIIRSLSNVFHSISRMFDNFADTAAYAKKAVKAWRNERIANTLLKIMAAVVILVGLVFALSFITPERAKKMGEAFVVVATTALLIIGLLLAVGKAAKPFENGAKGMTALFLSITATVLILSKVIKILGEQFTQNTKTMVIGAIAVITMLTLLWLAIFAIAKTAGNSWNVDKKLLGMAAAIAAIGLSCLLIAKSMQAMVDSIGNGKEAEKKWIDAYLAIISLILILAGSTWLISTQKSAAGVKSLVALLIVLRFMLVPMLKSLSKDGVDIKQALAAIVLPLAALAGYLILIAKMFKKKDDSKTVIKSILAMAAMLWIINQTIVPALKEIGNLENVLQASLGVVAILLGVAATFSILAKTFGDIEWSTIAKTATALVVAAGAISLAMIAMGNAIGAAGSSDGFLSMGLSLAVVLIALSGAMFLIGKFASSAIIGATALLILAAAIALLTKAIIDFKKYVLGEDIGDAAEMVSNAADTGTKVNKVNLKEKMKSAKNGLANNNSKKIVQKQGADDAVEYSKGFEKGTKSVKASKNQKDAAENMAEGVYYNSKKSISTEEAYAKLGIDMSENVSDSLNSKDSQEQLSKGGVNLTSGLANGLSTEKALSVLQNGGDATIQSYIDSLTNGNNPDLLNGGGEELVNGLVDGFSSDGSESSLTDGANGIGEYLNGENGLGGVDLTAGAEELMSSLGINLTSDGSQGSLTNGTINVGNFLNGENGFGGISLGGSGESLISSLTGGMTDSISGSFLTGAVDGICDAIETRFKNRLISFADTVIKPFAWLFDQLFDTDILDTGKFDADIREAKQEIDENWAHLRERWYQNADKDKDWWENELILTGYYHNPTDSKGLDELYQYMSDKIAKEEALYEEAKKSSELQQSINEESDRLWNLYKGIVNLQKEDSPIHLDERDIEWFGLFKQYWEEYDRYINTTGDLTVKYEDILDSILSTKEKMKEVLGTDDLTGYKGFEGKSISQLVEEFKKNGTVLFDMGKSNAEEVTKGFEKGTGDSPKKLATGFFDEYQKAFRDDRQFGIHSPSEWAAEMFKFLMEGFVKGMMNTMNKLDIPLTLMRFKIAAYTLQIISDVQYLLDNTNLELKITPVIDMDNFEYELGGLRFDKNGNAISKRSINLARDISTSSASNLQNSVNFDNGLMQGMKDLTKAVKEYGSTVPQVNIRNSYGIETVIEAINRHTLRTNGQKAIK